VLGLDADSVNVKAKTAEKMGPVGEGRPSRRARCACCTRAAERPAGRPELRLGRALQPDVGHQPAVGRVGQLQLPAHALHRLLDDGQAQAGAGGRGARGVAAEERRGQLASFSAATPGPWSRTVRITQGPVRAWSRSPSAMPVSVPRP
jgi:hypothetical protein